MEEIQSTRRLQRAVARRGNVGAKTRLQIVGEYASTPTGKKAVTADIAAYAAENDVETATWLRTGLRTGIAKAEVDAATVILIQKAKGKAHRAIHGSVVPLKRTRNMEYERSLAHCYPEIAKLWDVEANEGIRADEVTPNVNAYVFWVCEFGHKWRTRGNNTGQNAAKGKPNRCARCLGGRQKAFKNTQENLQPFVSAMGDDPDAWESLSPAMRYAILSRAGMLSGSASDFEKATALALASNDLTLREVMAANLVEQVEGNIDVDAESDREISNNNSEDSVAGSEGGFTGDDMDERVSLIMGSAGVAALVAEDQELVGQIVRENVENLWNEAYNNPDELESLVSKVQSSAGDNQYRSLVAERFEEELRVVQGTALPEGYQTTRVKPNGVSEEMDPLLSQRRFMTLVEDRRRVMNWSGTGAGKTLSGVLSSRHINAQETLVMCPLSVVDRWADEYRQAYPDTDIRIGLPSEGEDLDATSNGRPRVWIANYDKLSANADGAAAVLGPLAERLDCAVLDEVHLAKQADPNTPSQRRGVLQGFLDKAGANNPNLAVIGQSATPVVTSLEEAKSLLRLTMGEEPRNFKTENTKRNAAVAYQHMAAAGVRYRPNYKPTLEKEEDVIDVTASLPVIMSRVSHMAEGDARAMSNPSFMERALLPEKMPLIVEKVRNAEGPTIVYSEYTTGMVLPIVERLRSEGITAEKFTGDESKEERTRLIGAFQRGEIKVLVGSRPIATGVDGLQRVCRNMVVASMPWTAAQDDQLVGRIYRQGQTENVKVSYVMTKADVAGTEWSWCKGRMNRVKFRRSLADAVVDGVMPEGQLSSGDAAAKDSVNALRNLAAAYTEQRSSARSATG